MHCHGSIAVPGRSAMGRGKSAASSTLRQPVDITMRRDLCVSEARAESRAVARPPPSRSLKRSGAAELELWGGLECTIVRIGDAFRNQIEETGHFRRWDDLDLIAGLGIRTLRYPVLWETVCPNDGEIASWRWHDARL